MQRPGLVEVVVPVDVVVTVEERSGAERSGEESRAEQRRAEQSSSTHRTPVKSEQAGGWQSSATSVPEELGWPKM